MHERNGLNVPLDLATLKPQPVALRAPSIGACDFEMSPAERRNLKRWIGTGGKSQRGRHGAWIVQPPAYSSQPRSASG